MPIGLAVSLYRMNFCLKGLKQGSKLSSKEREATYSSVGLKTVPIEAIRQPLQSLGNRVSGLRIVQHNAIPLARGLGGSGTAVLAGTIAAFYCSLGSDRKRSRVLDQSFTMETHPDNITPSLVGGLTVSIIDDGHVDY